jgi:hypothetical protein
MLPDKLKTGDWLVTKNGREVIVLRTSEKDPVYDMVRYRLKYVSQYGTVVSTKRWTRDELQDEGLEMKGDTGELHGTGTD